MFDFLYLLSNYFDYSKMICDDNGPNYARSQMWKSDYIKADLPSDKVLIFDNRIYTVDFPLISEIILNSNNVLLFKVVDGMEEALDKENMRFILAISPKRNIFFYSPYADSYIVQELIKRHGQRKVLIIPYAYEISKELEIDLHLRKNKVIVSGSLSAYAYPVRWYFHTSTYRKFWAFNKVDYLKHPGYADIGGKKIHGIIGYKYLSFLAKYRFMLVTSSRWDYELLKYKECAYSGCALVGNLPSSITLSKGDIPGLMTVETDVKALVEVILSLSNEELLSHIISYRNWFRNNRTADKLNRQLSINIQSAYVSY